MSIYKDFFNLLFSKKETLSRQNNTAIDEDFDADEKLLDEEKNLIEFIRHNIKSSKVNNEIFRLQNLLNEIYGLTEHIIQKKSIEFLYDIDKSVPIELVGDTLILEQMLYNLLIYILEDNQDITLIVRFKKEDDKLVIEILCHSCSSDQNNDKTFKKLSEQLLLKVDGILSVEKKSSSTLYRIAIPIPHNDLYQENHYKLPPHIEEKKILLIEDHKISADIIVKMFTQFKLDIAVETSDTLPSIRDFDTYDMIILDEKRITPILMRHLHSIKEKHDIKIISFEKLFGWHKDRRLKLNKLIDKYLYKPLSRGMVSGLLYEMFNIRTDESMVVNEENSNKVLKRDGKILFLEETKNITRESFEDFGKKHILIVEDNKINQRIIQSVLEVSSIKTTLACNGYEALKYLDNDHSIDMVLMDINMPKMDGYQATKQIRKNERLSNLPIVIISGLGFRNEIEQMYHVGADAHLTKPFKVGQLYTAFKMFLDKEDTQEYTRHVAQYYEDNNILNTKEGIEKMHNALAYYDALREILVRLKNSDHVIKEKIIKKEFVALKEYCQLLHEDTTLVEAKSLSDVLHEMLVLIKNSEKQLLEHYITLYHEEWIKTRRNIELFLKKI